MLISAYFLTIDYIIICNGGKGSIVYTLAPAIFFVAVRSLSSALQPPSKRTRASLLTTSLVGAVVSTVSL